MQKFSTLKSIPAYLPIVNIDTDMIIPKQFLKTIKRTGLGKSLFFEMRYDEHGKKIDEFILNKNPFNNSKILIAGKNFGCGSSREHAPWALLDFGITCVISSSFADIFYNNCFKNGILPIILAEEKIKELSEYAIRKEEILVGLSPCHPRCPEKARKKSLFALFLTSGNQEGSAESGFLSLSRPSCPSPRQTIRAVVCDAAVVV